MTYVVRSDHMETLVSGRTVARGEEIPTAEARKNPRLIERGVLVGRPSKTTKTKPVPKPPVTPEEKTAPASAPKKEESK